MKIYSKLLAALALVPLMAGLTACSEDHADYTAAQKLANAQVYFDTEVPQNVELSLTESSFDVTLHRVKTDGELTVELTTTQDEASTSQLNVPASVTFADGEKDATITVTYDPSTIEFDDKNNVKIAIADSTYTTPYGFSVYSFTAYVPEPWTEWAYTASAFAADGGQGDFPLGTDGDGKGDYTYGGFYFDGDDPGLPVSFRQNKLNPEQGEFKIEHWGADVDLVMPAEWDEAAQYWRIYVPQTYIGAKYQSEYDIYVGDYIAFYEYMGRGTLTWDILKRNGLESYYDPATGKFTLYVRYYLELGGFGDGNEYFQVHGFYVADYSAVPTFEGVLTKEDVPYAQIFVEFGTDVQKALAYVVEASADADAVADALAAGEVEGTELVAGINNVPIGDLTGNLQVVVASVVDGEVQYSDAVKFEYYGGGENPWESLGVGLYHEPLVGDAYGLTALDVEVEILEHKENAGLYRLVDPYGENWGYARNNQATPCDYLEVDAQDAEGAFVQAQQIGVDLEGGKPLGMESLGGYFLTRYPFATVKGAGYLGTLENGIITLPTFQASDMYDEVEAGSEDDYTFQGLLYYGDKIYDGMNDFKVTLPEAVTSAARKQAASRAAAKWAKRTSLSHNWSKRANHKVRKPHMPKQLSKTFTKVTVR